MVSNRIQQELATLPECYSAGPVVDDLSVWQGVLTGPNNTPYEGGMFEVCVRLPDDYPFSPPKVKFMTKIFHCNISPDGQINLYILHGGWNPKFTLMEVLTAIKELLAKPSASPGDVLVPEVAELYLGDRCRHDTMARACTRRYAVI
eukprot:gnl/TRDRNA2_/TRDRNA2_204606_c0_seq1.p1 gnl/TRDRNA2_/TRDRNA2_204606_c0~~gnl/TRDRNA2_/TRDRNA2_204606_c0_seq1.p1  ORF type:complete len:158 (-),score=24.13 gnl/TRDRNA2_/TRDRNA2_204606_c0_seq1:160-600(-)